MEGVLAAGGSTSAEAPVAPGLRREPFPAGGGGGGSPGNRRPSRSGSSRSGGQRQGSGGQEPTGVTRRRGRRSHHRRPERRGKRGGRRHPDQPAAGGTAVPGARTGPRRGHRRGAGRVGLPVYVAAVGVRGGGRPAVMVVLWQRAPGPVLRAVGAATQPRGDRPRLHNLVDGLCATMGLPQPAIAVVDSPVPNAMALGRDPRSATLVVTSALDQVLTPGGVGGGAGPRAGPHQAPRHRAGHGGRAPSRPRCRW